MQSEINYLGYLVNKGCVRPDPANVNAVTHFPITKNVAHVHSFLGLVSYFRRFTENFLVIATPLYALLRMDAQFKLDEEELKAFEFLKNK